MGLLDTIFGNNNSAAPQPMQPAPQQAAPQQPSPQPQQATATSQDPTPNQPADPFADMWKITDEQKAATAPLDFNLDSNKLAEIAGNIDYTQSITPELRQRIAMGGDDAVAATLEAMNIMSRQNYQQNAVATTKLIEAAVAAQTDKLTAQIDQRLKLSGLNEALASNPALSSPKYAPVVDAVKHAIVLKYPNATQAEINKMTTNYLQDLGSDMNPELAKRANAKSNNGAINLNNLQPETDWYEYLNS